MVSGAKTLTQMDGGDGTLMVTRRQLRIILSLLFPIVLLGALVAHKQWVLQHGAEIHLPIEGFDPRDLLSGHYLTFRINYGIPVCINNPENNGSSSRLQEYPAHVCLAPPGFAFGHTANTECSLFILGNCQGSNFRAGIERFYIPEEYARPLDTEVRNKKGEIILSVSASGTATIKGLLINGTPWQEAVTPQSPRR